MAKETEKKKININYKLIARVLVIIAFSLGAGALIGGFIGLIAALLYWAFTTIFWLGLVLSGGIVMIIAFFAALYLRDE